MLNGDGDPLKGVANFFTLDSSDPEAPLVAWGVTNAAQEGIYTLTVSGSLSLDHPRNVDVA